MSNPNGQVDVKALQAQIAQLQADKAALEHAARAKVSFKVSEKGAVSVYGMGRFPVTLYASQWVTLLDMSSQLTAFIQANRDKLAVKGAAKAA